MRNCKKIVLVFEYCVVIVDLVLCNCDLLILHRSLHPIRNPHLYQSWVLVISDTSKWHVLPSLCDNIKLQLTASAPMQGG